MGNLKYGKIAFCMTPAFNPNAGGVQRTTYKLGRYFTEMGFTVLYFSTSHTGHTEVEYGHLEYAPEQGGFQNKSNFKYLSKVLNSFQPDIVINQMPYVKPLRETLASSKEELGFLLLGCLRNSLFNFKNNARDRMREMFPYPLFKVLNNNLGEAIVQKRHWLSHSKDLKAIIDQHDYFILLAPPNRKELEYFVGQYKQQKVVSIPNSIPTVQLEVPKKDKIILHVGRINVQQKRSDLLLDFWEHLYEKLPEWTFVIVGDGEYYQELEADLNKRKLPRVELKGYQKPEPYFQKAAIFMMPSAYEGFPNTLLEAQSYGCASLAFNSYAALDWIVNDRENAILIPPFNTKQMAESVRRLASNENDLTTMQEQALANARKFTITHVGQIWLDFFNKVLEN